MLLDMEEPQCWKQAFANCSLELLKRKALTPNDLADRQAMQNRILGFQEQYNLTAKPFNWRFTKQDMKERIGRLDWAA